jgi:hypothetical protein
MIDFFEANRAMIYGFREIPNGQICIWWSYVVLP